MKTLPALFPARLTSRFWCECRDADEAARSVFSRHYSRYIYLDGRKPKKIVGPGFYMLLITPDEKAILCWKKFRDQSGQQGINCSIFRNERAYEGVVKSSDLILDAEDLAWNRWPGERLYTYVNPRKVESRNPGYCFQRAGWRRCGITKARKLLILEKQPARIEPQTETSKGESK